MNTPRDSSLLEIQYHPADIRRGVRYVFLSHSRARWVAGGLLAFGLFLLVGLALIPRAFANVRSLADYERQLTIREISGASLDTNLQAIAELDRSTHRTRIEMAGIYLAYGFDESQLQGQGGYPFAAEQAPDSIFSKEISFGNELIARVGEQLGVLSVFLDEVQAFEIANREHVRQTPSTSPLAGEDFVLTSPFGSRRSPFTKKLDFHAGVDMAAAFGTEIRAPADGRVSFAGRYPLKQDVGWWRYGNMVAIQHGEQFVTIFGHCATVEVESGQKVRQGDVIATVGDSGWSTNPHLHYEVRRLEGKTHVPVDPRIYILDHRWRDHERLLVQARRAPDADKFEPLPRRIAR